MRPLAQSALSFRIPTNTLKCLTSRLRQVWRSSRMPWATRPHPNRLYPGPRALNREDTRARLLVVQACWKHKKAKFWSVKHGLPRCWLHHHAIAFCVRQIVYESNDVPSRSYQTNLKHHSLSTRPGALRLAWQWVLVGKF